MSSLPMQRTGRCDPDAADHRRAPPPRNVNLYRTWGGKLPKRGGQLLVSPL